METLEGIDVKNIINKDGSSVEIDTLKGKVIGLYFSAHWCGPCRGFTPKLAEKYKALKEAGNPFEIIFISADDDEETAMKYFAEMPWKMLSYHDRDGERHLSQKYMVQGIPSLVLLNEDGTVITSEGCDCVMKASFERWITWDAERIAEQERIARELEELKASFNIYSYLSECNILDHDGKAVKSDRLDGKVIGMYFSAHWCPPCRRFTPILAQKYKEIINAGHGFEIVFVSSDRDKASAEEYFSEMPWTMFDYSDEKRKDQLSEVFDISGIPTLILLDKDGIITNNGREIITSVPFEQWRSHVEEMRLEKERIIAICKELPDEITVSQHPHPLRKLPSVYQGYYSCDACGMAGEDWVYHCDDCGWDAHPLCVCKDPRIP